MQHSTALEGDRYAAFEHPAHPDDEKPRLLTPDQRRRAAEIRRAEADRRMDRAGLGLGVATNQTVLSRRTLQNARAVPRSAAGRAACASNVDLFERLGGNGSPNSADKTAAAKVCAACALGETCAFRVKGGGRR